MTFLRRLDLIADAESDAVGEKAFLLSQLHRHQFPTVSGSILGSESWEICLNRLFQRSTPPPDPLKSFSLNDPIALQGLARTLRQTLLEQPLQLDLGALLNSFQSSWLILRSSLSVTEPSQPLFATDLMGLVPAQICLAQTTAVLPALKQLWAESLRAYNLVTWQKFCQSLRQIRLATIIQPLCPAQVSGTLIVSSQATLIEAVLGLGLALAQGEAIPARCYTSRSGEAGKAGELGPWQVGYQERVYLLQESPPLPGERLITQTRDTPELPCPLMTHQVDSLLHLGYQVQHALQLETPAIRLEWILYEDPATEESAIAITQVTPWVEPPVPPPVTLASPAHAFATPDSLPLVRAVVQGIGAAPGKIMAPAVVLPEGQIQTAQLPLGSIVVLPDLQPAMGVRLQGAVGIVTLRGGATCHAAILARELGIPAVVGAPQATHLITTGDALWLDGDRGLVYLLPEDQMLQPLPMSVTARKSSQQVVPAASPLLKIQPTQTQVMVNLSQTQRLADLARAQVDGVGLLRSEWLLMDAFEGKHPQHWVQAGLGVNLQAKIVDKLRPILAAFAPKPVRYRSLDLCLQEWDALLGSPVPELNPILGLHGTFSYQLDPRLFEIELSALAELQRQGYTNLQLMLPFVRTVEEFLVCRQWVDRAGLFQVPDFQLWIMAEVPSILFLVSAYRQAGVQGIAIGTNDLTQLLLAVDRSQPTMAALYDESHPAVLAALAHLIQTARREGIHCSICGQAPVRHPELIESLVQWGIHSISVEPGAIATTREAILKAEQQWHS